MKRGREFTLLVSLFMAYAGPGTANELKPQERYRRPDIAEIKKMLSPEQFEVTQEEGTEKPFKNQYWDHHEAGIYVDIVSGEPLFSSLDKFDSKTGWPSFTKPLVKEHIRERKDSRFGLFPRTEVRSRYGDSHLGHVFDDGPAPTGLRYCVNSAALTFIPVAKLQEAGYGDFLSLFTTSSPASVPTTAQQVPAKTAATIQAKTLAKTPTGPKLATAVFAGGCFWCLEPPFEALPGVKAVVSGYLGGRQANPSYEEVSAGRSGHLEAVQISFDENEVTYEQLLEVFWVNIDPLDGDGQFCDKGSQYRSAIFYLNATQKAQAQASQEKLLKHPKMAGKSVATELLPGAPFYPAEDYHQDYYKKNPVRYKFYRSRCGRDQRLDELWGSARKL